MLSILRYGNEVRPAKSYFEGITAEPKPDAVALAAELIKRMSGRFEPEKMPDEYAGAVQELVRAKVENRAPEVVIESNGKRKPPVINIMDALKASMQKQGQAKVRDAVRKRMGKAAPKRKHPDRQPAAAQARGAAYTKHGWPRARRERVGNTIFIFASPNWRNGVAQTHYSYGWDDLPYSGVCIPHKGTGSQTGPR